MEFVTREGLARCIDSFDPRNAFRREFIFRLQVNERLGYRAAVASTITLWNSVTSWRRIQVVRPVSEPYLVSGILSLSSARNNLPSFVEAQTDTLG
jgi:hypothetical protein